MSSHIRLRVTDQSCLHLFRVPGIEPRCGTIVFSHGFLVPGFESHRMFMELASRASAKGWDVALFDYRGSGYSDLRFGDMTFATEVEDLHAVLDEVCAPGAPLAVWGQSMGSAVACEVVSARTDVKALICWALSTKLYERFSERAGFRDLATHPSAFLDSGFEVTRTMLESFQQEDATAAVKRSPIPKLFVHGDADDKAPVELSREVFAEAAGPKELVIIPGGGHGFKAQPQAFDQACEASFAWLERTLRQ